MPLTATRKNEPIPGYFVKERLGAGGYGEVWTAEAPGGLIKAVKFVFGFLDDERASRELKALNRVKAVRHPFMLSLERIEIVDGQLVIVTELADMSVRDLYQEHRTSSEPGIPRDDLLNLMRDTADALDYMSTKHGLQHLDVKPENLLIVGGRVKVADFGLVKDIQDSSISLMGGLTPHYAAPEVFDGRPTLHSDQYSLAIVYQEMLTGVRPFPGRTPAQLAAQHLQGAPQLSSLPSADQLIIARALAKRPGDRFANCREMVDALIQGRSAQAPPPNVSSGRVSAEFEAVNAPARELNTEEMRTRQGLRSRSAASAAAAPLTGLPRLPDSAEVRSMPPVDLSCETAVHPPTIFLAVGGTGVTAIAKLRQIMHDRFGDISELPAVATLAIDTDGKSLSRRSEMQMGEAGFSTEESLHLPLRRTQEYRSQSDRLLRWMSRRWLYNIPRSLNTEGLRPLGRLALVDHAGELHERLCQSLESITRGPFGPAPKRAELNFTQAPPRVVVVSSICGGAGGGMALDLAYFARSAMADLNLDGEVCGLLTYSTSRHGTNKELAIANAFSFLTEWSHFSSNAGYPGDEACGVPPFDHRRPAFDGSHLVHLGDDLSEDEFDQAMDDLAEFLCLRCFTPAAAFFDKTQQQQTPAASAAPTLRTFGLSQIGGSQSRLVSETADLVAAHVLTRWTGESIEQKAAGGKFVRPLDETQIAASAATPDAAQIELVAAHHARESKLDLPHAVQSVERAVGEIFDGNPDEYFCAILDQHPAEVLDARHLIASFNAILGHRDVDGMELSLNSAETLETRLDHPLREMARRQVAAITECVVRVMDSSSSMIPLGERVVQWYTGHVKAIETTSGQMREAVEQDVLQLERALLQPHADGIAGAAAELRSQLVKYARLRRTEIALHGVAKFGNMVRAQLSFVADQIKTVRRDFQRLAEQLSDIDTSEPTPALEALRERLPELASPVDRKVRESLFPQHGGFQAVLERQFDIIGALTPALQAESRAAVLEGLKRINASGALASSGASDGATHIEEALEATHSVLSRCGGARRLLLAVPSGADASLCVDAASRQGAHPTICMHEGSEAVACQELDQIPLSHVAAMLVEHRPDCAQAAARLHTRNDIAWNPWERST